MAQDFEAGGSERQFTALANALEPGVFRLRLGSIRRRGAFLEHVGNSPEFPLGGSFFSPRAHWSRLALARHLRAEGVAVAHSFEFYSNLMMIPVARWAGVPVVIGSHRQLGDLLSPLQLGAQLAAFHLCDYVVCNSQAAADLLANNGLPERKLIVIPNMLSSKAFAETAPAIPRLPGVLRVGMIARMNRQVKNHPAFLRAAARLSRKFSAVEFLLVGDGPLRAGLEQMAEKMGLSDRVIFLGDRRDIPAVLASLDVTVLPSLSESMPNVILESMAAGVPVVATRVGGNPEVVESGVTGLLVPPDDDDRLVEAVESLLRNTQLLEAFRRRAREFARVHFHGERIREKFEQLYLMGLEEKSRWPKANAPR